MRKQTKTAIQVIILVIIMLIGVNIANAATYYVDSSKGTDSNSGLSESAAIKTISKVNNLNLKPGDKVLFKRGSVWRCASDYILKTNSGSSSGNITYGAYGSGSKPLLLGSIEANDDSDWSNIGTNLWRTTFTIDDDVGNIIFNQEAKIGSKVDYRSSLKTQGDFFYDTSANKVIVYSASNPSQYYSDIELAKKGNLIEVLDASYVVVENLDLRYSGKDAVFVLDSDNINLRNLSVAFSGGSYQEGTLRYGNGIEFLGNIKRAVVEYCRINQVYDAGVSNQQDPYPLADQSIIYYRYNVISNTRYCFEFFNHNELSYTGNIYFLHNTCYNSGKGFGGTNWGKHLRTGASVGRIETFIIKDNIFSSSTDRAIEINDFFSDSDIEFDNNLYWEPSSSNILIDWQSTIYEYGEFSKYQDERNQDIHSVKSDPLFSGASSGDFTPKAGSPACTMSSTGGYVGALPCAGTQPTPVCGDKICNGKENCSTCSGDCGTCPLPTNHAPTQSTPLLRASDYPNNTTNANLTCYNQSTADADKDKVVNIYRWYRNSSLMTSFNNRTLITASNTEVGQRWVCEVTPYDGKLYGKSMNSSPLIIRANPVCGDKICNGKENCTTCSSDCGTCPVTPVCGDKICNGKENCTTCSGDCGTCALPKITGCVLEDISWDENTALKKVFNLSSCFKDPLKTTLTYSVKGNKQIKVTITSGMVDLSSAADWTGVEHVVFVATSGTRSASTNNITLTVNYATVCGDDVCEDNLGETCTSCSADCDVCPKPKSSGGGGGGGGGGSFTPGTSSTTNNTPNATGNAGVVPFVITTLPPDISEGNQEPAKEPALIEGTSNLETTTGLGLQEPEPTVGSAVTEPLGNPSSNNLVPIVFVTLALVLVAPGVYLISRNQEQLLAKLKKMHKVVYYEDDISDKNDRSSSSDYFNRLQNFVLSAIDKWPGSINQIVAKFKKSNKVVYLEDDASQKEVPDYFTRLHELVSTAISRGHDKLLVASKLRDSGWSEEVIESVLDKHNKEFVIKTLESSGIDAKHADALHNYVKKALERGHVWTNIANDLLRVGWTSKVVDCLLKTYCDTSLSFLPSFHPSGLEEKIA